MAAERKWWTDLDPADWLFDGRPIKIGWMDAWKKLDWSKAWLDMGPSPAGNPGPYFHVPDDDDDCVHRLYPKLLRKPNLQAMVDGIMSTAHAAGRREGLESAAKLAEEKFTIGQGWVYRYGPELAASIRSKVEG